MAGFNISTFRSQGLVRGGARPTNFIVTMTFPDLITLPEVSQKMQFLCTAANLPESTLGNVPVAYFGRTIQLAGNRSFEDWDVTILNDEDFLIRNAFEAWHNSINTIVSNRLDSRVANIDTALGDSYKTTALVTQFSKEGPGDIDGPGAIKTYKFEGIFPKLVSSIPLAYDSTNVIEQFQVRFTYDWYEPYITADSKPIFPIELADD